MSSSGRHSAHIRLDPWLTIGKGTAPVRGGESKPERIPGATGNVRYRDKVASQTPSCEGSPIRQFVLSKSERDDRQTSNVVEFLRNAIATKRKLYGRTVKELSDIFKLVDRDGSGTINHEEFRNAMRRLGLGLSDLQVEELMAHFDADGDGFIDQVEFMRQLEKKPKRKVFEPRKVATQAKLTARDRRGDTKNEINSSVTDLKREEVALHRRTEKLERDRAALEEKKKQAEIRHHERQLRQHAAKELMEFEATIKSELDTQIEALVLEKATKLQSIADFQAELHTKILQLQGMVADCDEKAGARPNQLLPTVQPA